MFLSVFNFELRYWLRQPSIWLYALVFFALPAAVIAGAAGIWGDDSVSSSEPVNTPLGLFSFVLFFNKLLLPVLPAIVGQAVYRDFNSKTHHILYAYPLSKSGYLLGKFWSAFSVIAVLGLLVCAGIWFGTVIPGVNRALLLPFDLGTYLQLLCVYLLPNLLYFSVAVFALVTASRNVYAGFTGIIVLLVFRELLTRILGSESSVLGLLDPLGETGTQANARMLAAHGQVNVSALGLTIVLYNRILWFGVAVILAAWLYRWFRFDQYGAAFEAKRSKGKPVVAAFFKARGVPRVSCRYSLKDQLRAVWSSSWLDYKSIVTGGSFISVAIAGTLFVLALLFQMNPAYAARVLPLTWVMLAFPVFFYSLLVQVLTFFYAGVLIRRARSTGMQDLIDSCPVPDWALLLSKWLTLLKIQATLLLALMAAGISVQVFSGFYRIEPGHYLFDLLVLHLAGFAVWAFAALFIQTVFPNTFLGLFILVLAALGISELPQMGVQALAFRFNQNPEPNLFLHYADMSGYGHGLYPYILYKIYWIICGILLFCGALLCWQRGRMESIGERWQAVRQRMRPGMAGFLLVVSGFFLSAGAWMYMQEKKGPKALSDADIHKISLAADRNYASYASMLQPRVVSVDIDADLFPEMRRFTVSGVYTLVNKSGQNLDSLLLQTAFNVQTQFHLDRPGDIVFRDTLAGFYMLRFEETLQPGDSLHLHFNVESIPNTILQKNSIIEKNGTFLTSALFPSVGYYLPDTAALPTDRFARRNHYRSVDSDFIDFHATVSTDTGQIALAPGYLKKEWTSGNRQYFEYASEGKTTNDYAFLSGWFAVKKYLWKDIQLEIYHHPAHTYNLDDMLHGLKACIDYHDQNFGSYQHRHIRIVEFSRALGNFAQSFANTIPYSESNFIMDTRTGLNLPFLGAAHEMAHQWWGHQVIPANTLGARMLTESMAEYVALQVLRREFGPEQAQLFVQKSRSVYLKKRHPVRERPLAYTAGLSEPHVAYHKGVLALNALCSHLGEERLNSALRAFLQQVKFREAPYTTSLDMLNYIRAVTPDSMQYLIKDLFETVTFYDNRVLSAQTTALPNGKYQIDLEFIISKYRLDAQGQKVFEDTPGLALNYKNAANDAPIRSLPLVDYVDIAFYRSATTTTPVLLQKIKVKGILNHLSVELAESPVSVCIDPFLLLPDLVIEDNKKVFPLNQN